jgi:hypothetical protein
VRGGRGGEVYEAREFLLSPPPPPLFSPHHLRYARPS